MGPVRHCPQLYSEDHREKTSFVHTTLTVSPAKPINSQSVIKHTKFFTKGIKLRPYSAKDLINSDAG